MSTNFACWAFICSIWPSKVAICVATSCLRWSGGARQFLITALQRLARGVIVGLHARGELRFLKLEPLLLRHDVGNAPAQVLELLELLLVRIVECHALDLRPGQESS